MPSQIGNNPFTTKPLSNVSLFAGRKTETLQIQYILKKHTLQSFMIVGERGMGKTSLLNYTESICKYENIVPVRVNLTTGGVENANIFFANLFIKSVEACLERSLLGSQSNVIYKIIEEYKHKGFIENVNEWVFDTLNSNIQPNSETLIRDFNRLLGLVNTSVQENKDARLLFLLDEAEKYMIKLI